MKNRLLALAAFSLCGASAAFGYTQTQNQGGFFIRWPNNTQVTFVLNNQFAPNNPPLLVNAAIDNVIRTWNAALSSSGISLRVVDGGPTGLNTSQCDQVNLISFTDTQSDLQFSPSTLAVARTFTVNGVGTLSDCGPTIQTQFAGQIVDADIIFNSSIQCPDGTIGSCYSTVGLANTLDIEPVLLHEMGHTLGLNHSGVNIAIMNPAGDAAGTQRRLQPDDIAGINFVYGTNGPGGAISGRVSDQNNADLIGAQVVATNNDTGVIVAASLSGPGGTYRIVGLPPGNYKVFVEPLDGPIFLSDVSKAFSNGTSSFLTVFRSGVVRVGAGEVTGIDFTGVSLQAAMNAQSLGVGIIPPGPPPPSIPFVIGPPPLPVKRGNSALIVVDGTTLSGEITFSSPKITPTGNTTTDSGRKFRTVQVAADAPLGGTDVYMTSTSLSGGLQVIVNPAIGSGGVADAAAFQHTFAPGGIVAIFGTDMAEAVEVASALPLPTQLRGVSVQIGDRLAPLFFVSPGQINAMVPFEVSGNVNVQIVAGISLLGLGTSNAAPITLSNSAPRVFTTNSQGTGQGAILIAATGALAGPSSPARRGQDYISIYCTALGPVTNQPPSGVPSVPPSQFFPAKTTETPRITIGGVQADTSDPNFFSGLAPFFAGLYQINVKVPANAPTGSAVQVGVSTSGGASNPVTMAIQ